MNKVLTAAVIAVAVTGMSGVAFAEDLKFRLTNSSSYTITNFYTSPATTSNWEEDVFGNGVLESGSSVDVTIADGSDQCLYDMKFVPQDAQDFVVAGIDLCQLDGNEYVLSDAQ